MLFVSYTPQGYASVGVSLIKDLYLMGTFPLPFPNKISSPIHMVYSITSGSLDSYDPWVVPRLLQIDSCATYMLLLLVWVFSFMIQSTFVDPELGLPQYVEPD